MQLQFCNNSKSPKRPVSQSFDAMDNNEHHLNNLVDNKEDCIPESVANFEEGSSEEEDQNSGGDAMDVVRVNHTSWYLLAVIVLIVSIFLSMFAWQFYTAEKSCAFEKLRGIKPIQSERVWRALQKGIEGLINKRDPRPSVFLFLHEDKSLMTLIENITIEASGCFGRPGKLMHMNIDDFAPPTKDYGFGIAQFQKKLKDGKVFRIVSLNEIPPNSARALHTICDTYSPIAADAVIFLTLQTFNTTDSGNSVELAWETLFELWGTHLADYELNALITRVTDQVLHLKSKI
ncbi:uncharacterized protein LOC108154847 [Drosophila miranda]|uniref:uncharacterized protein LOC108154847 n=1 Tax=Drosophila miranda TaxID=7229 RepID=UPI0007E7F57A|nr:uncharacterized protein LOC108154847 [Drosophila miranda]